MTGINKLSSVPSDNLAKYQEIAKRENCYLKDIPVYLKSKEIFNQYEEISQKHQKKLGEKWAKAEAVIEKKHGIDAKQSTWLGSLVWLITGENFLIKKIRNILTSIFKPVAEELAVQDKLSRELKALGEEYDVLGKAESKLFNEAENLYSKGMEQFNIFEKLQESKQADDKIMDLFGGRENFEKLPILDVDKIKGNEGYDYIDFITPNDMTAPIMRGKDRYGREFFSIRAQDIGGNTAVQTIFKRYSEGNIWTSGGSQIIRINSFLIDFLKIEKKPYQELKTLIETGSVEAFRRVGSPNHTVKYTLC